jgi:anti-sigma factor RsiW
MRLRSGIACQEMVELVTDYLEGALSWRDRRRFERHIAGCEHCGAYLEQMRQTLRVLGRIDEETISPEARDALLHAFRGWSAG